MDALSAFLDLVKILFALGLFSYGMKLYRIFRGGIMQGAFKFLMVAPLFFAITEIIRLLKNTGVVLFNLNAQNVIATSFEILFIIAMFVGFYRLASAWKIREKPSN